MHGCVSGFALITAPVLTFLFTDRDDAIAKNSNKNRNRAVMSFLADHTAPCSTIGYHRTAAVLSFSLVPTLKP